MNPRSVLAGAMSAAILMTGSPAHAQRLEDPNDSPGKLDIAVVSHTIHSVGQGTRLRRYVTFRMKTYDRWSSNVLLYNEIHIELRRGPEAEIQRVVLIRMNHGRLKGTISTTRRVVAHAHVRRPNRRTVVVRATLRKLVGRHMHHPQYRWMTIYNSGRADDIHCGNPSDVSILCSDETNPWIRLRR